MFQLAVVVIGCWTLCSLPGNTALHTGISDDLLALQDNMKVKFGIDTLLKLQKDFYVDDFDDDFMVEYLDIITQLERSDVNGDGVWTYEESVTDPDHDVVTRETFMTYDNDGDGKVTVDDFRLYFELLPGTGDHLDLEEYLTIEATISYESQGPEVAIKAFVRAEKDFRIMDMDDNWFLTRKEFEMAFKHADRNNDGKLTGYEILNLFPMRSTPPTNICENSDGCTLDDVMLLFDSALKGNNSKLYIDEYIRYFSPLIVV